MSDTFLARFLDDHVAEPMFKRSYHGYGIDEAALRTLSDSITRRVAERDLDHDASRSPNDLAFLIRQAVDRVATRMEPPNDLLLQRMRVEGTLAWVRLRFSYNRALGDPTLPREIQKRFWWTKDLLAGAKLQGVCNGFSRTALDLVRLVCRGISIEAHLVNGSSRPFLPIRAFTPKSDHSWLIVVQSDGHPLLADLVKSNIALSAARQRRDSLHNPWCLPIGRRETALFLTTDMAIDYDGRVALPPELRLMSCDVDSWSKLDALPVEHLVRWGVELSKTALIDEPLL